MGGKSKAIGKTGEREAKKVLALLGCHTSFTEIQGLAGDDIFTKDPNGKWWSVEVKNTTAYKSDFLVQAKRQAKERYEEIQKQLNGVHGDMYRFMGLDSYTANDYFVMWHPRGSNIGMDTWSAYVSLGNRIRCRHIDSEEGWQLG